MKLKEEHNIDVDKMKMSPSQTQSQPQAQEQAQAALSDSEVLRRENASRIGRFVETELRKRGVHGER